MKNSALLLGTRGGYLVFPKLFVTHNNGNVNNLGCCEGSVWVMFVKDLFKCQEIPELSGIFIIMSW